MKLHDKLYVIEKMSRLIERERTGNATSFAQQLGISRSQLFIEIDELKSLDVDINFNRCKNSFVFSGDRKIKVIDPILIIEKEELPKINGGNTGKRTLVKMAGLFPVNLAHGPSYQG